MKKVFSVEKDFIDSRFDRWFRKNISNVPQSLIEKSLRKGKIKINSKKIKSGYKLKENDLIYIYNLNFSSKKLKQIKAYTKLPIKNYPPHPKYLLKIMKILL